MSKAVFVRENGGPEVLSFEDRTLDAPSANEIQVRHEAIGLNFIDVYLRTGLYPAKLPTVLGQEAAGIVTKIGDNVTDFKPGDRITYFGPTGSYAQERNMPAANAIPAPDDVPLDIAAAITLKGITACYLLTMTWPLKKGETILFHAAAGGVGQIAVQWAKHIGATVIATVGSDEKAEIVRGLGADHVINMRKESFAERVEQITGGKGVDVVYDSLGKDTFDGSLASLRTRGLMVSFGNTTGAVSVPNLGILTAKGLYLTRPSIYPYLSEPEPTRAAAAQLFNLVMKGVLSINIGQRFSLEDAAKAHIALESRQTVGSTIIEP